MPTPALSPTTDVRLRWTLLNEQAFKKSFMHTALKRITFNVKSLRSTVRDDERTRIDGMNKRAMQRDRASTRIANLSLVSARKILRL